MLNQIKPYLLGIAVLLALVGAGLGFYSWLQSHDAALQLAIISQQKDQQIAQRDKENAALKDQIAHAPMQQVVKYIPQIVNVPANTPEPVLIEHPPQLAPQDVAKLPDAPSALLPQTTLRLLESAAADDANCLKDLSDTKDKYQAAVKAAKGGSFWKRLKANKDAVIVGGVLGAAITVALKH